jgi:hypothetical protein
MKSKLLFPLLLGLVSSGLILGVFAHSSSQARAVLINPRFGAPIRTATTAGSNSTALTLKETIHIQIGLDPADQTVPQAWLNPNRWKVGFTPVYLTNGSLIEGTVISSTPSVIDFIAFGGGDSGRLIKNAVDLEIALPGNIQPGLYNLHAAFAQNLPITNLRVFPGSYMSERGIAGLNPSPFILSETNAIYVPSNQDGSATDGSAGMLNPFSLIQITDVHVAFDPANPGVPANQAFLENLAQALSIWAPDAVIITGDLTNSPGSYPAEYELAYQFYRSFGLPTIMSNGNHDHGNLGLFIHYFGPLVQNNLWGGTSIIGFDSVIPINTDLLGWVVNQMKISHAVGRRTFLTFHIPAMDVYYRDIAGSTAVMFDAMLAYSGAAFLNGHNHYNLVIDIARARTPYYGLSTDLTGICDIPSVVGDVVPSEYSPKLMITTSGGKGARDNLAEGGIWPEYQAYEGYRRITMVNNQIVNYTYDLDGDGFRDPSYSQPLMALNASQLYDSNNPMAGLQYQIINNLTEPIPWARAAIVVEKPPIGSQWWPVDGTSVIRAHFSNGTHEYFDVRLPVAARSTATVQLMPIPEVR